MARKPDSQKHPIAVWARDQRKANGFRRSEDLAEAIQQRLGFRPDPGTLRQFEASEVRSVERSLPALDEAAARPSVAILVDDLVWWFDAGMQPSGIQRVVIGLLDTALARADINAWPAVLIEDRIVAIDRAVVQRSPRNPVGTGLIRARARVTRLPLPGALRAIARRVYRWLAPRIIRKRSTREVPPPDLVLVPGAFWAGDWYWAIGRIAKRLPVRVVVYDLFPETNPEWVQPAVRQRFRDSVRHILPLCDRVVTFGETPAEHLRRLYPLTGKQLRVAVPDLAAHAARGHPVPALIAEPYLLVVGPVEPRKNQRLVLDAWGLARPRLGFGSLVIAGRRGEEAEELEAEIEYDRNYLSLIRRDHVTDAELDSLYEGAVATVHASWAEGFGLPARESIARGVPALMSSTIPRDGLTEGFQLFDPTDDARLAELMMEALRNPTRLEPAKRDGRTGWEPVLSALVD